MQNRLSLLKLRLLYSALLVHDEFIDRDGRIKLVVIVKDNLNPNHTEMLKNIIHKVFHLDDKSVKVIRAKDELGVLEIVKNTCILIFDPSLCSILNLQESLGVIQNLAGNKAMCTFSLEDLENNVTLKKKSMAHFGVLKSYL